MTNSKEEHQLPEQRTPSVKGLHAIIEHSGEISGFDCQQLDDLLRKAAEAAGATILTSRFHDFGDGLGNTGVLVLAESHISVHTWPENNYAAIDIFVCSKIGHNGMEPVEAAVEVLRSADRQGCFHCHVIERAVPNSAPQLVATELTGSPQTNLNRSQNANH
jgi:S-adenosylmethionine decarboxylase